MCACVHARFICVPNWNASPLDLLSTEACVDKARAEEFEQRASELAQKASALSFSLHLQPPSCFPFLAFHFGFANEECSL